MSQMLSIVKLIVSSKKKTCSLWIQKKNGITVQQSYCFYMFWIFSFIFISSGERHKIPPRMRCLKNREIFVKSDSFWAISVRWFPILQEEKRDTHKKTFCLHGEKRSIFNMYIDVCIHILQHKSTLSVRMMHTHRKVWLFWLTDTRNTLIYRIRLYVCSTYSTQECVARGRRRNKWVRFLHFSLTVSCAWLHFGDFHCQNIYGSEEIPQWSCIATCRFLIMRPLVITNGGINKPIECVRQTEIHWVETNRWNFDF